jgi:hypothetical protein
LSAFATILACLCDHSGAKAGTKKFKGMHEKAQRQARIGVKAGTKKFKGRHKKAQRQARMNRHKITQE